MKEPTTLNDIQKLNGRLAALSRFLSKGAERALPFLKLLRGVSSTKKVTSKRKIVWDEDCNRAFQELKEYLGNIPLLTRPLPGDILILYMTVMPEAGSSILMREEEGEQQPIYYVSNTFKNPELRYSRIEKVGFTLL